MGKKQITSEVEGFSVSFINTKQKINYEYVNGSNNVMVYITLFQGGHGSSLPESFKQYVHNDFWSKKNQDLVEQPLENIKEFSVLETNYHNGNDYLLTWSWFYIGDKMAGDAKWAGVFEKIQKIVQQKARKGVVVIVAKARNEADARVNIENFSNGFVGNFPSYF